MLRAYVKAQKDAGRYDFIADFESRRAAGIAMKKGETGLRDAVNRALLGLEASGEAAYIYDAWFGPKSENRAAAHLPYPAGIASRYDALSWLGA